MILNKWIVTSGLLLSLCILVGCVTEKKIMVNSVEPDTLFIEAQKIFKEEMPRADIKVDLNQRVLRISDPNNIDYPKMIEMKFSKSQENTEVAFLIEDEDKQKIENLRYMLMSAVQKPKLAKMGEIENNQAPAILDRHSGFPVRTKRDRIMDRNKDGVVDQREVNFFKKLLEE